MVQKSILLLLNIGYVFLKRLLPYQVYAYLFVGALNTVLNVLLFMLCYQLFVNHSMAVEISTMIALLVTILTGFWLQKNFVFGTQQEEKKHGSKQLIRYSLVALNGQITAYILTKTMILVLYLNASLAYILTTIFMLALNYFLQKYFTFKKIKRFS